MRYLPRTCCSLETDPEGLGHLFELDHLATRIRRHSDGLLVLVGADPAWQWPRAAAFPDVVASVVVPARLLTAAPAVAKEMAGQRT